MQIIGIGIGYKKKKKYRSITNFFHTFQDLGITELKVNPETLSTNGL